MRGTNFTEIAARYDRDSLIQKSASERLLGLLEIKRTDRVLDLGCGTGTLTQKIRARTDGSVFGIDASPGMIREAERNRQGLDITYDVLTAEELDARDLFDVIFCNSAFQWFRTPGQALRNCHTALLAGGRMGIQAPATKTYCPNFLTALDAVRRDARTAKTFSGFQSPWLFFDTAEEYSALFRQAAFLVPFSIIEEVRTRHAPEEVMTIFESGAAAGYLNQEYYQDGIDDSYTGAFREIVRKAFREQAVHDGKVELLFNRIYLVAIKG